MAATSGEFFSCIVTQNGQLFTFGVNDACQLGVAHGMQLTRPALIDTNVVFNGHAVVMASAGSAHAGCLTSDGGVYMWGSGDFGQLALGDLTMIARVPRRIPGRVFGGSRVQMIACGADFSLALTGDGVVWSSGLAYSGQLGSGNHQGQTNFQPIEASKFNNVAIGFIAAGVGHSMALSRQGGMLWTWGLNRNGQLGQGTWVLSVSTPTLVEMDSGPRGGDFVYMDGGGDFSMAVTASGALWSCGNGADGALGIDIQEMSMNTFGCVWDPVRTGRSGVRTVSCGYSHTLLVTKDDVVWVSGDRGSWTDAESVQEEPGVSAAIFRRIDPTLFQNSNIKVVSAGNETSMAVSAEGRLFLWGDHKHHTGEQPRPMQVCLSEFLHTPVGRWHHLSPSHILALCMG